MKDCSAVACGAQWHCPPHQFCSKNVNILLLPTSYIDTS
uniref:Uncharacterized protein n=1 Tax=Heterorhabditis bacteriophora TaxID=37862 RepID=A0A1I7XPS3_HETBA